MNTKGRNLYIHRNLLALAIICLMAMSTGCRKLAEVDAPSTTTSSENVYKDDATASAVFIGLYTRISQNYFSGGLVTFSGIGDLSADNIALFDVNSGRGATRYYQNNLEQNYDDEGTTFWHVGYDLLYTINDAIIRLKDNDNLTPVVRKRLLGEAYFLRAFCYFYLVNMYGDVPLILITDPVINSKAGRAPVTEVYTQMNEDLANAEQLLTMDYVPTDVTKTTSDKVRPNLAAVNALQARIFLYQKKYAEAEAAASKVIAQSKYALTAPGLTFLKNSSETIWGLQTVSFGINTYASQYLLLPESGPDGGNYNRVLTTSLLNNFEPGDLRRSDWVSSVQVDGNKYYYPTKYRQPVVGGSEEIQEYDIVLRLAEQYLIRAEARNEQNNTSGAIQDLNTLRDDRRGPETIDVDNPLPAIDAAITQTQLKSIILSERRSELFTEWGHRWFDLRRSGTIDAVMIQEVKDKGVTWESYKALYPVPARDILVDKALTQNKGY
ncbi:MAG: RagB/SusD family nutrient uptake outer membrane protein [Bacteroidota bacterium]